MRREWRFYQYWLRVHHNHLFDFLSVPCCKADKDAYAHEADNPVHCAACQEDIDDNADEQANQCHVEERTESCKAVFSEIAVDGHCSEHTCRDEECLCNRCSRICKQDDGEHYACQYGIQIEQQCATPELILWMAPEREMTMTI